MLSNDFHRFKIRVVCIQTIFELIILLFTIYHEAIIVLRRDFLTKIFFNLFRG